MCMPHRRNWFPPPPHPKVSVSPLGSKGGGEQHSLAGEGVGGPNSDDWIEGLALCILSGLGGRVERKALHAGGPSLVFYFIFGI
jgi:hypothetical protein